MERVGLVRRTKAPCIHYTKCWAQSQLSTGLYSLLPGAKFMASWAAQVSLLAHVSLHLYLKLVC